MLFSGGFGPADYPSLFVSATPVRCGHQISPCDAHGSAYGDAPDWCDAAMGDWWSSSGIISPIVSSASHNEKVTKSAVVASATSFAGSSVVDPQKPTITVARGARRRTRRTRYRARTGEPVLISDRQTNAALLSDGKDKLSEASVSADSTITPPIPRRASKRCAKQRAAASSSSLRPATQIIATFRESSD